METVFLGAIAVATVLMALVQVGIIVYARSSCRESGPDWSTVVETELKPALGSRVNDMSDDLNRATSLAVAQVERADQLFAKSRRAGRSRDTDCAGRRGRAVSTGLGAGSGFQGCDRRVEGGGGTAWSSLGASRICW